jgi:type VI secretion system secreted protein Hcp
MQIQGISGNVTDANHKNWIQIKSMHTEMGRMVNHRVGFGEPRDSSIPKFETMEIAKRADNASGDLYQRACSGKTMPLVKIHICNESNSQSPYVEYLLSDVLITRFIDSANKSGMPSEQLHLSYLKMERSYINKTASGALSAPKRVGYDLMKAVVS